MISNVPRNRSILAVLSTLMPCLRFGDIEVGVITSGMARFAEGFEREIRVVGKCKVQMMMVTA